ncbi:MAG: hypothetical protein AAFP68_07115 [Pseudomonadota bacterium]
MSITELVAQPATPETAAFTNVDDGDAVRARIHYLVAQNNAIIVQTQFADAKAAALLTLMGLLALRGPVPISSGPLGPLALGTLALITVSILLCLWALTPRFRGRIGKSKGAPGDRFTWTVLSNPDTSMHDHADFARSGDFAQLINSISMSNVGASMVLRRKFNAMQVAFGCAVLAILSSVFSLVT